MVWILSYLLVGFVMYWWGVAVMRMSEKLSWQLSLLATLFWPASLVLGPWLAFRELREERRARSVQ